jgi:hypothetical protein
MEDTQNQEGNTKGSFDEPGKDNIDISIDQC